MVHYPFFPIFVHDNGGDKLNMNINDDFIVSTLNYYLL